MHIEEWAQEVARGKIKTPNPEEVLIKHANLEVELNQLWEHISLAEWEAKRVLSEVELIEVLSALKYSLKTLYPFFTLNPESPAAPVGQEGLAALTPQASDEDSALSELSEPEGCLLYTSPSPRD